MGCAVYKEYAVETKDIAQHRDVPSIVQRLSPEVHRYYRWQYETYHAYKRYCVPENINFMVRIQNYAFICKNIARKYLILVVANNMTVVVVLD